MNCKTLTRTRPPALQPRAPCLQHIQARRMSRAAEAYYEQKARSQEADLAARPGDSSRKPVVEPSSNLLQRYSNILDERTSARRELEPIMELLDPVGRFEALGLHKPIVEAMHTAFPNVTHPTEMQTRLIPAILSGKDVLLKDDTGTGKTFGATLSLLSKPRVKYRTRNAHGRVTEKDTVTSIMIVPYRDLAYQILSWIESIVKNFGGATPPALSSLAQVLVRDGQTHLNEGLELLRKEPPHILIGTPQALLDVYRADPNAFRRNALSTVFVDEVDYLIETARDLGPQLSAKRKALERRIRKHPGVTRELLDIIYEERIRRNLDVQEESGLEEHQRFLGSSKRETIGGPQLVLASATLPAHLSAYVFQESGWWARHGYVRVMKGKEEGTAAAKTMGLGGSGVEHSVVLVGPESATNVPGAVPSTRIDELPSAISEEEQALDDDVLSEKEKQAFVGKPSTFNADIMEAIATAFALDVPSVALLVLPSSANVKRAVYDFRELGVNARPLDLSRDRERLVGGRSDFSGKPTMFVSTFSAIRGLDLPDLTHVFILGVLEREIVPRATDAYVHVAGRVGRSGRGGKVVSFIEATAVDFATEDADAAQEDKAAARQGDLWRLQRVFKRLGLRATAFPHFSDVEYEGGV